MGRTVPIEIVVLAIIVWLGFKAAQWWARARNAHEENERLRKENDQLKEDLAALADGRAAPVKKSGSSVDRA